MLLTPSGKGKGNNNHIVEPHEKAKGDADGGSNKKADGDDGGTTPRSHAPDAPNAKKGDGEAFAYGGDAPIRPKKEPGGWAQRTTPDKGADYQQKVTGSPKNMEYVVKTDRMKSGEKKLDGYDPETNTLIDAKDWDGWPPNGDSQFDKYARDKEVKNVIKDAKIAADKGANLEYHVPTETKKNQIMDMLGNKIPENFDIKVTPKD